jgi:hypothetical protein
VHARVCRAGIEQTRLNNNTPYETKILRPDLKN